MYFVRLRVRSRSYIDIPKEGAKFQFIGRDVVLKIDGEAHPSDEVVWVVFKSMGFTDEASAREFGRRLSTFLLIYSMNSNPTFDLGSDKSSFQFSDRVKQAVEATQPGAKFTESIHGLSVHDEDFEWTFASFNASGYITCSPDLLINAARQVYDTLPEVDSRIYGSLLLLSAAKHARSNLAKLILSIGAIERLGQDRPLTQDGKQILQSASQYALNLSFGTFEERQNLSEMISKIASNKSLRRGVTEVLSKTGREDLKAAWEAKYDIRSKVVHGLTVRRDEDLAADASEVVDLCAEILKHCYESGHWS